MSQGFSLLNTLSALFDVTALFDAKTRLYDIEVQDTSPGLFLVEAFRGGEAVDDLGVIEVICLSPVPPTLPVPKTPVVMALYPATA